MADQKAPRRTLLQRIVGKPAAPVDVAVAVESPVDRLARFREEEGRRREDLQADHKRISGITHAPLRAVLMEKYESDVVDLQLHELCSNTLERELIAGGTIQENPRLPTGEEDARRFVAELPRMSQISPTAAQMLVDGAGLTHDELAAAAREVGNRLWIAHPESGSRGFPDGMDPRTPVKVPAKAKNRFPELQDAGPVTSTSRRFPELAPATPASTSTDVAGFER